MTIDPAVALPLRVALALLFGFAAAHKLRDLQAFKAVLENYRLLPSARLDLFVWLVPVSEVGLLLALMTQPTARIAAAFAALLLTVYAAAIGINLLAGRRDLDCGCLGFAGRGSLSGALLVRNGVLVAAALLLVLPAGERELNWVDGVTVAAATVLLALLYAAADGLIANRSSLRGLGSTHPTPNALRPTIAD